MAFLVFGLVSLPSFLKRVRQEPEPARLWNERLGRLSPREEGRERTLWIHAVSVGEVMAVKGLVEKILERLPAHSILLTTVTPTGQQLARQMAGPRVRVSYFPFDVSACCRAFFRTFEPECLLLAETEIWPNLLREAARAGVPVGIVNARLSARSARRYGAFAWLFRPFFRQLAFVLAQTEEDAARFAACGVENGRVQVLGNMKFDIPETAAVSSLAMRAQWGIAPGDAVWIAGSTHPGEEEVMVRVWSALKGKFPMKLILAPRHIERSTTLAAGLAGAGAVRRATEQDGRWDILILDRLGVLKDLYQIADVVFTGGSLVAHGGQNPIEAARFQKPVLHGPHVFNFQKVYEVLDREAGALLVSDEKSLEAALARLLADAGERSRFGVRAQAAVRRLQGATERHLDWVAGFLAARKQERTMRDGQISEKLFPSVGGRV